MGGGERGTGNRDVAIGRQFADRYSLHRFRPSEREDSEVAASSGVAPPLPQKRYPDAARVELPPVSHLRLGDPLPRLAAEPEGPGPAGWRDLSALERVACLLEFGVGLNRVELTSGGTFHRTVASARSLHPTVLYVAAPAPGGEGGAGGLFHFAPFRHALSRIRSSDVREDLVAACGESLGADATPSLVVVVTSVFGRTSYKYGDFAYRLCCHEAGIVAANLRILARAAGLECRLAFRFLDARIEDIVDLPPEDEGVMAVATIEASTGESRGERRLAVPMGGDAPRPPPRPDPRSYLDAGWHPELSSFHAASRLEAPPVSDSRAGGERASGRGGEETEPREAGGPTRRDATDLSDVLLRRRSGADNRVSPRPEPLALEELRTLTRSAGWVPSGTGPGPATGGEPSLELYWVVNRVEGLEAGVYRHHGEAGLDQLRAEELGRDLQRTYTQPNVNLQSVPCTGYMTGSYSEYFRAYGNRGYRVANLQAGAMAHRMTVAAGVLGYCCRCLDGFYEVSVNDLLGLPDGDQPLFQVVVFRRRPAAGFATPIRY